jgi:hypothetical protein
MAIDGDLYVTTIANERPARNRGNEEKYRRLIRNIPAAYLLHATSLQMRCFPATQKLLNHTKDWKVSFYESGRLN